MRVLQVANIDPTNINNTTIAFIVFVVVGVVAAACTRNREIKDANGSMRHEIQIGCQPTKRLFVWMWDLVAFFIFFSFFFRFSYTLHLFAVKKGNHLKVNIINRANASLTKRLNEHSLDFRAIECLEIFYTSKFSCMPFFCVVENELNGTEQLNSWCSNVLNNLKCSVLNCGLYTNTFTPIPIFNVRCVYVWLKKKSSELQKISLWDSFMFHKFNCRLDAHPHH